MSKFRSLTVFVLVCAALAFFPGRASAQLEMRGLEIGPWIGLSHYFGDLNTDFKINRPNFAGGVGARYNFNHRLAAKASLNYGKVEAYDNESDNPFERNRNLSFQSSIVELTGQFEFNFLPYFHGHKDFWYTPYAFAGVTVFRYNPKTEAANGNLVELRELGTEGQLRGEEYLLYGGAFTGGVGFKWDVSYEWSIDMHFGVRSTWTDYIDDVSTTYPDFSDLQRSRGPLAAELYDRGLMRDDEGNRIDRQGEQRGDPTVNDFYVFAGIGFNYYFGDVRCPGFGHQKARRR